MYRNIILELRIKEEAIGRFNKEKILCERKFERDFGRFEVPTMIYGDGKEYHIPDDKVDTNELKRLVLGLQPFYSIDCWIKPVFSEDDFRNAPAAMVDFPFGFEEYDNFHDREELVSAVEVCEVCNATKLKKSLILKIDPTFAKAFKKSFQGLSSDSGAQIVSIPLYEYLIGSGIDGTCFYPVYNIKKNIVGYCLNGSGNLLPAGALCKEGTSYNYQKCGACGRISIKEEQIDEEEDSVFKRFRLRKDAVEALQGVNATYEYWPFERRLLVSRELLLLMGKKWPDILQFAEPVFPLLHAEVE